MDAVDGFFTACLEDRLEEVVAQLNGDAGLVHARRIGGRTPLHQAAFGGALRVAALLIDRGADVNAITEYGWAPLHYAAAPASPAVADLLIRKGAALDTTNDDGCTPLHFAVDFGKLPMVEMLLSQGAAPNTRDREGRTPIDYAESESEIAGLLRTKGAVAATPARAEAPRVELPDWLEGSQEAIGELFSTVEKHWNVPVRGQQVASDESE